MWWRSGATQWVQPGKFVGNGPFKLVSWRLGDYIRVEKNPLFFDAGKVCVDRIDYYPTSDSVMAERRIARGELDINTNFQSNRIGRLREADAADRAHPRFIGHLVPVDEHP